MYLMTENNNQIDLYLFKPIRKKIWEYRKSIIDINPLKGYHLQTNANIQNKNIPNLQPTILTEEDINNYLNGIYDKQKAVAINHVGNMRTVMQYLLFIRSYFPKEQDSSTILELSHELYLLHLLLNGNFEEVVNADILNQLSLFNINYIRSFLLKDIKDLVKVGLITKDIDSIREEAQIGTKILKLVKNDAKH